MAVTTARLPGITFETRTPSVLSPLPRMDIAGFVGFAAAGPVNVPVAVEEAAQFHDVFGEDLALARDDRSGKPVYAELPAAVRAFFRNGGMRCWIVRIAGPAASANRFAVPGLLTAVSGTPGVGAALAFARSAGSWSDPLLVNTTITKTLLPVFESSPPGFIVGGLKPGDLVQIDYPALGIVAFQAVPADRRRRPPLSVALPEPSHWFRSAVRSDVDPLPPSPPDALTWLPAPVAVRWLIGAAPDPPLPVARWGVGDTGFVVELDRGQLRGVQPGSWLLAELATAPPDAKPFLLLQVDRIHAAAKPGPAPSPEPVWITTARAWWILDENEAALAVDGVPPRASVVTFEMSTRAPERDTARLADLGFAVEHARYWGHVPDDEIVYRPDPKRPGRREQVSPSLLAAVRSPRFPLAAPAPDRDVAKRPLWPLFLPLGMTGVRRDDFYQPALPPAAGPLERDGLTALTPGLFLDPELSGAGTTTLMSEAFQIQYVTAYGDTQDADPWQDAGRALRGVHALLPVEEVSMIAVPDALQRPWYPEPSMITPLGAPTLIEVAAREETVHVEWTPVGGSPPEDGLTYTVQTSLDPRFAVVARAWTTEGLTLDHNADVCRRCPTAAFYRVRATSLALGTGPWSNTLWEGVPPSVFERCPDEQPPPPAPVTVTEARGRLIVTWGPVTSDIVFTLERAADPEFASASVVYTGSARTYEVLRGAEPVVYFRVAVDIDGRRSPWSVTVRAGVVESSTFVTTPAEGWEERDERRLLDVQAAVVRMCAARGDLHAVLGLPLHFRDDRALEYAARLAGTLAGDEPRVLSYAAMFHPWVVVRETEGRADLATWAIAPDGPLCGTIAARTLRTGAWYSPANQVLDGVLALEPPLGDALSKLLDGRVNPIRQQPRGFVAADALTLSPGDELGELHVRRLLILLRRLAAREGTAMVFRPNDDSLRRLVQREFERVLGDLFVRGAFAGLTHDEGYQVVAGAGVNTPQGIDQGRFIVELRVAPSYPLKFLTVRLVQEGGALLALRED